MGVSIQRIKDVLLAAGLYGPMRRLNLSSSGRDAARARNKMRTFFGTLLPKDALVFDIGANVGTLSEAFACVGASVVAVEPNVHSARHIQLMHSSKRIQVIQAAVGSQNGLAILNISPDWHPTCTLSAEWMERIQKADGRYKGNWTKATTVPVLTLDTLVQHFGEPYFIKIDVEGYERQVLSGLSKQPALLSFEYHNAFISAALDCLNLPLWADGSFFNIVESSGWGYPSQFKFNEWIDKQHVCQVLMRLPGSNDQGDIYVRRPT